MRRPPAHDTLLQSPVAVTARHTTASTVPAKVPSAFARFNQECDMLQLFENAMGWLRRGLHMRGQGRKKAAAGAAAATAIPQGVDFRLAATVTKRCKCCLLPMPKSPKE